MRKPLVARRRGTYILPSYTCRSGQVPSTRLFARVRPSCHDHEAVERHFRAHNYLIVEGAYILQPPLYFSAPIWRLGLPLSTACGFRSRKYSHFNFRIVGIAGFDGSISSHRICLPTRRPPRRLWRRGARTIRLGLDLERATVSRPAKARDEADQEHSVVATRYTAAPAAALLSQQQSHATGPTMGMDECQQY